MPLALKRPPRFLPRGPRAATEIHTRLLLADDRTAEVTLRNLSERGFMGECACPVPEGDWVGVDLPGFGIVPARVRWRAGAEIGCRFRRSIALDRVGALQAHSRAGTRSLFASV